ncbi:unnamed protein product [Eretmochelys imbricata]
MEGPARGGAGLERGLLQGFRERCARRLGHDILREQLAAGAADPLRRRTAPPARRLQ